MGFILFAALIGIPLLEIAVFIQIGGLIGGWSTIGLVLLTAILGAGLLRQQGLATLNRARKELEAQQLPVQELFDGVCLLFAGAFLLTPGFVTDTIGFLLLLPVARAVLRRVLWATVQRHGGVNFSTGGWTTENGSRRQTGRDANGFDETVIDGEFHEVEDGVPEVSGPKTPED